MIKIKEISFPEVVSIHKQIPEFNEGKIENTFDEKIGNKKHIMFGAYVDEELCGYTIGYDKFHDGSLYCRMAGVKPSMRKNGCLSILITELENWARRKGYTKLTIKTRNTRREMLSFLVKNNFLFTQIDVFPTPENNRISLEKSL